MQAVVAAVGVGEAAAVERDADDELGGGTPPVAAEPSNGAAEYLPPSGPAINKFLRDVGGDTGALPRYGERLARAFAAYRDEALRLYRAERRWPTAPSWQRRHALC